MKHFTLLLLAVIALVLSGCADSGTQGDSTRRDYKDLVSIKDNADTTVTLTINLSASSDTDTATKQDTKNSASVSPRTSAGWNGGTAGMATDGAEFMMEGVSSLFQQWQDLRKTDSENTTTPPNVTVPPTGIPPTGTPPIDVPVLPPSIGPLTYYPFHHTQFDGPDKDKITGKGISVVLCPGDLTKTFNCMQGDIVVPYHGVSKNRASYWNMKDSGTGDVVCKDGNKTYVFHADKDADRGMVYGSCE
jgi:hypothetical protein